MLKKMFFFVVVVLVRLEGLPETVPENSDYYKLFIQWNKKHRQKIQKLQNWEKLRGEYVKFFFQNKSLYFFVVVVVVIKISILEFDSKCHEKSQIYYFLLFTSIFGSLVLFLMLMTIHGALQFSRYYYFLTFSPLYLFIGALITASVTLVIAESK